MHVCAFTAQIQKTLDFFYTALYLKDTLFFAMAVSPRRLLYLIQVLFMTFSTPGVQAVV